MSRKEKLIKRFLSQPKDFTFQELVTLFSIFGFTVNKKGTTSGSRVEFVNDAAEKSYSMHKPHPSNVLKPYAMKQALDFLKDENFVKE